MTFPRLRLLSVALVTASLLLATACGDDDADTAVSDTEETSSTEDSAGDDADFAAEGECAFLGEFATGVEDAFDVEGALSGGEKVDFGAMFAPLAEEIEDVAAAAPDEVRGAFETVADSLQEAATALEGVVIDMSDPENFDPEALAELEALEDSFGAEFEAAAEGIESWIGENCPAG